jgi:hypothetical protein
MMRLRLRALFLDLESAKLNKKLFFDAALASEREMPQLLAATAQAPAPQHWIILLKFSKQ